MLGLGVERGGRFVENQQQRPLAHEAARQRELLPLAERHIHAAPPGRTKLRVKARREARDYVVGAGAADGRTDRGGVLDARDVAGADALLRAELEPEEILERA